MPRRLPVIVLFFCVLATAVSCGGGGSSTSSDDDIDQLDPPIDTGTAPCLRRLDLIVFVNPAVDPSQYEAIAASLGAVPGVVGISLVDQEAAYDELVRLFPNTPGIGTLDPTNLPASFRITLDDPARANDVRTVAQTIDGVGDVQLTKDSPQPVAASIPC